MKLLVRPGELPRILNRSLYPAEHDHELTLAEAVAQIPAMLGEAIGDLAGDLSALITPLGDCRTCMTLTSALVSALVIILVEPLVAPASLFLEWISVISALLPGGDINRVGSGLVRRWTGDVLEHGLGHHLERWYGIARLCIGVGLGYLVLQVPRDKNQDPYRRLRELASQRAGRGESRNRVPARYHVTEGPGRGEGRGRGRTLER